MDLPQNTRVANKYNRVVDAILIKIASGEYAGMLPGTKQLAEEYGVSLMTADKAVKVLEKEKLVVRLPRKGTLINSPKKSRTETLALIVRNVTMPLTSRVVGEFGKLARENGYQALFFQHFDDSRKELDIIQELLAGDKLDGVVIVPCSRNENGKALRRLVKEKVPVVILDLARLTCNITGCHIIAFDEREAFENGTQNLIALGHKKIRVVFPRIWDGIPLPADYKHYPRWIGYADAMKSAGLRPLPPVWVDAEQMQGHLDNAWITKTIKPCTALFLHHDTFAVTFLSFLHQAGIRVPEDVSLLSYDGAPLVDPFELSTMELPMEEAAQYAVHVLQKAQEHPSDKDAETAVFKAKFCLRRSASVLPS